MVDTGNSNAVAARPKAPPTAPAADAAAKCHRLWALAVALTPSERTATRKAPFNADSVASAATFRAEVGSARPIARTLSPNSRMSRLAKVSLSRSRTASARAASSSLDRVGGIT